jgi:hypothetical protein
MKRICEGHRVSVISDTGVAIQSPDGRLIE